MSALVQAAVKGIVKRSLEPAVPHRNEIPNYCRKRLEDFGKLALAALREGRCYYTETELRTRGGGIEIAKLGFLNKGMFKQFYKLIRTLSQINLQSSIYILILKFYKKLIQIKN